MGYDSSQSGYHERKPGLAGLEDTEDWGDDFPKTFTVNLIWAQARDNEGREGAIGFHGGMPWHLAEDMKRFKELTVSHPVIMGRKTWESLDPRFRPLPNRDNIVVSRNSGYVAPGATVVENLDDAFDLARQEAIRDLSAASVAAPVLKRHSPSSPRSSQKSFTSVLPLRCTMSMTWMIDSV